MWSRSNTVIFFLLQGLIAACAMQEPTQTTATHSAPSLAQTTAAVEYGGTATAIHLERAVHFSAPEGDDVLVPPGEYQVEPTEEAQLQLVPTDEKPPLLIAASTTGFDLDVAVPVALTVPYGAKMPTTWCCSCRAARRWTASAPIAEPGRAGRS